MCKRTQNMNKTENEMIIEAMEAGVCVCVCGSCGAT